MAIMMGSLYQALKDAGAPEASARTAAEEAAGHEQRFAKIESELTVLKWMTGFILAMTTAILAKLLI